MHSEELIIVIMGSFAIIAGVVIIWMVMQSSRHVREMEHRERLAMIERGLIPSPETDPQGFERMIGMGRPPETQGAARARSAGVIMIGLGLAFMFMLTFAAGAPGVGVGIGGAFALIGVASFVNGVLSTRSTRYVPPTSYGYQPQRPAPPQPPPPPQNHS